MASDQGLIVFISAGKVKISGRADSSAGGGLVKNDHAKVKAVYVTKAFAGDRLDFYNNNTQSGDLPFGIDMGAVQHIPTLNIVFGKALNIKVTGTTAEAIIIVE